MYPAYRSIAAPRKASTVLANRSSDLRGARRSVRRQSGGQGAATGAGLATTRRARRWGKRSGDVYGVRGPHHHSQDFKCIS